ncbi:hypothetical protein, partial [Salmonella sp. s51884]|uniref:hypothetical protein n=1 Tax=Salmonella sp. s51884 TaxID=3159654 RepID=UPI00397FB575
MPKHEREEVEFIGRMGEKPALSKEMLAWKLAKKQRDYSPSTTSEAISISDLQHHYRTRTTGEQYLVSDRWTSNIAVSPIRSVVRRRGRSPIREGALSPLILGRRGST